MKSLGFSEWKDAFNRENIPSTKIDKSFHIQTVAGNGIKQNQQDIETEIPVTISFFKKGYATPADAIDDSIELIEDMVTDLLAPAQRLSTSGIKNIKFNGWALEPLADSNDNIILATVEFTCFVILGV